MIRSISYENFKLLGGSTIQLGSLTLLTGTNASGKSSTIQSILLARAALRTEGDSVRLNDEHGLNLGNAEDVISHRQDGGYSESVLLDFETDQGRSEFRFSAKAENRFLKTLSRPSTFPLIDVNRPGGFTYLSASRHGGLDNEELPSVPSELLQIGSKGENTAATLLRHELSQVNVLLEHPTAPKLKLFKQAEAWLGNFVPRVRLRFESSSELARVGIRFRCEDMSVDWLKPGNFGFGASYCLPIVVAGLQTDEKSLLIVDGPEAHLHPSAQSAMGEFLALVASAGAQVIIETHSDHVLNGVRLAALKGAAPSRSEIVINHFSRSDGFNIEQIGITEKGELSSRPNDFFDQAEKDLAEIVRQRFSKD